MSLFIFHTVKISACADVPPLDIFFTITFSTTTSQNKICWIFIYYCLLEICWIFSNNLQETASKRFKFNAYLLAKCELISQLASKNQGTCIFLVLIIQQTLKKYLISINCLLRSIIISL